MKQLKTDVLIIGLGPAGASAATRAAQAGARVLAIDRKQTVGLPVQCAEFLPRPMGAYAQAAGVHMQNIAGMRTRLPSGVTAQNDFAGLMIDRAAFDQALAHQAQVQGAQLLTGSALQALDSTRCRAYANLVSDQIEIEYKILIAADGPKSRVATCVGLKQLESVVTRQYRVELVAAYQDTDIWLSPAYSGGYAWLFPKGAHANLGLGVSAAFAHTLKPSLDDLHQALYADGRVGSAVYGRTGGHIPVSGLREKIVLNNILFVGDAAGLAHPITGAGISAALVSGEYAGQAAADYLAGKPHALTDFDAAVRDHFGAHLDHARQRRVALLQARVCDDALCRQTWIAFPQYYAARTSPAHHVTAASTTSKVLHA